MSSPSLDGGDLDWSRHETRRVLLLFRPTVRTSLGRKADAGKMNGAGHVCLKSACEFIIFVDFVMWHDIKVEYSIPLKDRDKNYSKKTGNFK